MGFTHGSNYGYLRKHCKCELCKAWWRNYSKEYRDRRMAQTGEVFNGNKGGFLPGKPCACGCGKNLRKDSNRAYRNGHKPVKETASEPAKPAIESLP